MPRPAARFDAGSVREAWDCAADIYTKAQASGRDYYRYEFFGPAQAALCGDVAGLRVLDVGCGNGYFSRELASRGARVTGIDLSEKSLRVAELHCLQSKAQVTYERVTADDYAQRHAGAFDVVTCMELLEHVPEPAGMVAACARLARPGGQVFFSTINRNPKSYLFAVIGAEYVLRLLPRGTHDYARFIKPSELSRYAREAGLRVSELIGMTYNPLTQRYRLEADCDVNYLLRTVRDP